MADHDIEAALVSGAMPVDAHSILLSTGYQNRHTDMDVGFTMELVLGQKTVTVTISGLFDASKAANGHGAQAEKAVPGRTDAGTRVNYSE